MNGNEGLRIKGSGCPVQGTSWTWWFLWVCSNSGYSTIPCYSFYINTGTVLQVFWLPKVCLLMLFVGWEENQMRTRIMWEVKLCWKYANQVKQCLYNPSRTCPQHRHPQIEPGSRFAVSGSPWVNGGEPCQTSWRNEPQRKPGRHPTRRLSYWMPSLGFPPKTASSSHALGEDVVGLNQPTCKAVCGCTRGNTWAISWPESQQMWLLIGNVHPLQQTMPKKRIDDANVWFPGGLPREIEAVFETARAGIFLVKFESTA